MNNRAPILLVALTLAIGLGSVAAFFLLRPPPLRPIPNFIDNGGDAAVGEEQLADFQARFNTHLDSGRPFIDAFFSEIRLVDFTSVGIGPDDVLADLGCGVGTLPLALLAQGVEFKKIYALDINPYSLKFLRYALEKVGMPGYKKVFPKHSKRTDLTLAEDVLDLLFIVEVPAIYYSVTRTGHYAEDDGAFQQMETLFGSIRHALKPDGELHFIYPTYTPTSGELDSESLVAAMDTLGFSLLQVSTVMLQVENHYFIFVPKGSGSKDPLPRTIQAL